MAKLSSKIKIYLDRKVDFTKDVRLEDASDGRGAYIKEWNVAEAQPTDEQLDALDAQATTLEINNQVIATRKVYMEHLNNKLKILWKMDFNPK